MMDIKMQPIHKTPDLGDGRDGKVPVDPVSVTYKMKKNPSKDSCCSIDEEKQKLRAQRPVFRENFTEFCHGGTLHGVRHLVESYSMTRKIIWLVIIILIVISLLYNVIGVFVHYLAYPITTVIVTKHNQALEFPTVTLCNKNPCRMSSAYKRGWQGLLQTNVTLSRYLESVEVLDFYKTCGQTLDTMIVKCKYNGKVCDNKDFHETYTELGHCFSFNGFSPGHQSLVSSTAGPNTGLELLLNTETSEYSPSSSGQEGFQITVHDSSQVPGVLESGISVSPGTSTNIALKHSQMSVLPAPYGSCGTRELKTPGPYTQSKCRQQCLLDKVRKTCFCDAVFLNIPMTDTSFPICGMKIYESCVKPLRANFSNTDSCDCPATCLEKSYIPTVSFSRLSKQFIHGIIQNKTGFSTNIEKDFVQNKLLQYHHKNQHQENQRLDDVIKAYNRSVTQTYPLILSSMAEIASVLKNLTNEQNGRDQFLKFMDSFLKDYNTNYHATVFSAIQSASLLVNKYLDAVTAFAFVTDQVNYTHGNMDENRVSQILRLKLDEFRIHYEHTIQSLDRVDKFYSQNRLKDFTPEQNARRQEFRIGIISLYANISAISMHQNYNIDKFYHVADLFNQIILPRGADAYKWYGTQLKNLTEIVSRVSEKLSEKVRIVSAGPKQWDNFKDSTLYRTGVPSYVYEAEEHWLKIKADYLKSPGNVSLREFIIYKANRDLTNLSHFLHDLNQDLSNLETATSESLDLLEQVYTTIISSNILPSNVLGTYPIWNLTSKYLALRIRWKSLADRNRPVFKSIFADTIQRVREKVLSRKIERHYYPNGLFDTVKTGVRIMDEELQTSLTKLKDYMTYFVNSVSIEKVFKEQLYSDNFCQVNIYYKDLVYDHYQQQAMFTGSELFMYIGIFFAIYLGASLFTFVECLDALIRSVYTKYVLSKSLDT